MEPTVFLQRLRLAASSRLLNILSVAAGQLPGRVRWESSEAEGINKPRERTSALEHRVRTARRQRRRRHRGPKLHLPQLPPSFLGEAAASACGCKPPACCRKVPLGSSAAVSQRWALSLTLVDKVLPLQNPKLLKIMDIIQRLLSALLWIWSLILYTRLERQRKTHLLQNFGFLLLFLSMNVQICLE